MTQDPPEIESADIAVLASGGLDSCVLVAHLLAHGANPDFNRYARHGNHGEGAWTVQPIFVCHGLIWEQTELAHLRRFLALIDAPNLRPLVTLELPLTDLYNGHWSVTGRSVPDRTSPDEAVFLPGRNGLLAIKAVLWCQLHQVNRLALGVLGSNPFDDATPAFFRHFEAALNRGEVDHVEIQRPFASKSKEEVMRLGATLPLEATFSCIAPVGGMHCGNCNKCAERQKAFAIVGRVDPTAYASAPNRLSSSAPSVNRPRKIHVSNYS